MPSELTLAEMEAAGKKATAIRVAIERLEVARRNLALLKKHATEKRNSTWKPKLLLKQGISHHCDVTVEIDIPYGVVEQQLVDTVKRAYRAVIQLGGPCNV